MHCQPITLCDSLHHSAQTADLKNNFRNILFVLEKKPRVTNFIWVQVQFINTRRTCCQHHYSHQLHLYKDSQCFSKEQMTFSTMVLGKKVKLKALNTPPNKPNNTTEWGRAATAAGQSHTAMNHREPREQLLPVSEGRQNSNGNGKVKVQFCTGVVSKRISMKINLLFLCARVSH